MTEYGKLLPFIGEFDFQRTNQGFHVSLFDLMENGAGGASEFSQLNVAVCEIRI